MRKRRYILKKRQELSSIDNAICPKRARFLFPFCVHRSKVDELHACSLADERTISSPDSDDRFLFTPFRTNCCWLILFEEILVVTFFDGGAEANAACAANSSSSCFARRSWNSLSSRSSSSCFCLSSFSLISSTVPRKSDSSLSIPRTRFSVQYEEEIGVTQLRLGCATNASSDLRHVTLTKLSRLVEFFLFLQLLLL